MIAAAFLAAALLAPTGRYPIGRVSFTWSDPHRSEVYAKTPEPRTLRVHLFYPARDVAKAKRAPYVPDFDTIRKYAEEHFGKGYLREDFGSSYEALVTMIGDAYDAPTAAGSREKFPVVVFSHGGGIQVLYYSTLIQDLTSHGYVVAAVEHPYDMDMVVLPGGRVIEQEGWDDSKRTPAERAAFHRQRHEVNARDNSFVLDQLARIDSGAIASPLKGRLDLRRVAAAGHSLGGMSSVFSCALDPRFTACVNLDGGLDKGELYPPVTRQPILGIFGGPSPIQLPIESDESFAKRKTRNFREGAGHKALIAQYAQVASPGALVYITSPGFSHFSYYDLVRPEAEQWGATPERHERNLTLIRKTVLTFLDATLKRRVDPIAAVREIDGPLTIIPIGSSGSAAATDAQRR